MPIRDVTMRARGLCRCTKRAHDGAVGPLRHIKGQLGACCHFGKQEDTRVRDILQRCSGPVLYQDALSRVYVRALRPTTEV